MGRLRGKKDKNTFLFSFDNKEKYFEKNDYNTIYCEKGYGPIFGNFDEKMKPKPAFLEARPRPINYQQQIDLNRPMKQKEKVKKLSDYDSKYFYFEIYFDHSLNKGKFFSGSEVKHSYFSDNKILGADSWEVKELEVYKIIYI